MNEDRFADYLDEIANGAIPTDPDPLASFARHLHRQRNDDHLDDERRASIRKSVLGTHAGGAPTTGGAGPLTQPALIDPAAFNPWGARRRSRRPAPRRSQLGIISTGLPTAISAFAIAAIVIAALTAYPVLRRENMPDVTPTAYAAAPTVEGNQLGAQSSAPATAPTEDNEWLAYIQPEECTAEPLTILDIEPIIASPASLSPREYAPLTPPAGKDAEGAARAARDTIACMGPQYVALPQMTDRFISEMSGPESEFDQSEDLAARGREISEAYPDQAPGRFDRLSDEEPEDYTRGGWFHAPIFPVSIPSTAVQLPDGRIGVPMTNLYWENGAGAPTQADLDARSFVQSTFVILTNETDEWQVDEMLPFCVGQCDDFWESMTMGAGTPAATPDGTAETPTPPGAPRVVIPCPGGTPPWLTPVYPWGPTPAPPTNVPTISPEPWGPDDCAPVIQLSPSNETPGPDDTAVRNEGYADPTPVEIQALEEEIWTETVPSTDNDMYTNPTSRPIEALEPTETPQT